VNLTTLARVRRLLTAGGTTLPSGGDADTLLTELIADVSEAVDDTLDGRCLRGARTEYYSLDREQRLVWLRGWPVDTGSSFALYVDRLRAFGTETLVPAADYYLDAEDGSVRFDFFNPSSGPGVVKVVYTGGMAVDAAGIISAYPDLARIVDAQVVACWRARTNPAGTKAPRGGRGGSSAPEEEPGLILLPPWERLRPFARYRMGGGIGA